MELHGKFVLLALEQKTSAKGNSYVVGLFQQGTETLRAMVKIDKIPDDVKQYHEYELKLNYNEAYKRMDVVALKKV